MAKKAEKPERKPPTAKQAEAPAAAPAPVAKKTQAKPASTTAANAPNSPPNSPLIDTSLAANTAAALIANKAGKSGGGAAPPKKESAAFKQLKAGLNKPSAGAMGGAFGAAGQQKKSQQSHGGPKQVGRNQTFGADVNRAGVPRRTPG